MIGTQVEQYLIEKKLGNGAMGSVYLARDTRLNRPVALKFILADFNDHPDMAKRFLAEAQVLANLNCPNIPILYGYLIWEEKGVMVMEYVDGQTLEDMVRRRGPIPANVSVPFVKQALQGLVAAHRINVVHRDLKPSNLMLNREGIIKVVDFGIAKKIEVEAGLTRTNMTVGTPSYMAPEQIMGKPVTPQTDVYSMGVVLYELLAGQVPFQADSLFEIHTAHIQKVPDPPTVHYPYIPKPVVEAVMKALQKRPEDRFATADEFLRTLSDLQIDGGSPVDSIEIVSAPSSKFKEPSDIALASVESPQAVQQPPQPVRQIQQAVQQLPRQERLNEDPRPPRNKILLGSLTVGFLLAIAGGVVWLTSSRTERSAPKVIVPNQPTISSNEPILPSPEPSTSMPPLTKTPPKVKTPPVDKTPRGAEPKTSPPEPKLPGPVAGQELSGLWQGIYTDSNSPSETTRVQMQVQESGGTSVNGTLTFTKADNSSGKCSLSNSIYDTGAKKLKVLLHCTGPASPPGYFNTPTVFTVMNPSDKSLTGKILYFPKVTADIRRP